MRPGQDTCGQTVEVQQLQTWRGLIICSPSTTKSRIRLMPRSGRRAVARAGLIHSGPHVGPKKGSAVPLPPTLRDFSTSEGLAFMPVNWLPR